MPTRFSILLVEDDPSVVDLIIHTAQTSFGEANFIPVTSFAEAAEYLSSVAGRGPQLVLLDIGLGTSATGLDFLSLLQAHPLGKLVPVVILSASGSPTDRRMAYQQGASSFVQKPFTLAEWKGLLVALRTYWYQTVSVPRTWFDKDHQTD